MKSFTHHDAQSMDEAVELLRTYKGKARPNAGGTDLLGALKQGSLKEYPEALINIKSIHRGLDTIKEDRTGLRIGALTKLSVIAGSSTVTGAYSVLAQAVKSVATPLVRNMCTIGGNLAQDVRCWYYRYPEQIGGPITCLRKGGKICNALMGDNRYHSLFGAAPLQAYPCSSGCPADVNIASYMASIKNGNMKEAAHTILDYNPIPAITGRVCPIFCEPECNRGAFDEPVAISCVERTLGDYILERAKKFFTPPERESGRTIAVVGSGPAGLSSAYYLRRSGHRVTVFERMRDAGGMLLYSIPSYRLPKDVIKKQVQALENMGIKFQVGVRVGKDVTLTALMDRFAAVFVAGGAWKEKPLGIKGEKFALSGLEFLNNVNKGDRSLPGKKVAVIGGGNVAMDVARTLLRLGAEPVVLYRRTREEMPAFKDELRRAVDEGIEFQFLTLPVEAKKERSRDKRAKNSITLTCVRMRLGAPDASDRPQPVPLPGSEFAATFDAVIKAIGEEPDAALVPAELWTKPLRKASVVRVGRNLFAGGDFVTGPSTVVQALSAGREAAALIVSSLGMGRSVVREDRRERDFREPSFVTAARASVPETSIAERITNLEIEDVRSLSLTDAETEARRCFNCGCVAVAPSDIGVALIALGASIVTTKRTVGAESFFSDSSTAATVLDPDELITEIRVPKPPEKARQKFLKFTLREPVDFAIVSVASVIAMNDGLCDQVRIALGAVAPKPVRALAAEEILRGRPITEANAVEAAEAALAGALPLGMNAYKIEIAKTLVKRAILG